MSIFDRFTKKAETVVGSRASGSLSEALSIYRSGGRRAEPEFDQTQYWPEVRALMAPHLKLLAGECAEAYLKYVEKTGNTTCPEETVAHKMREILWEAWRRAGIPNKKKYAELNRLPDLAPYFVEVVKCLNSHETVSNYVAFVRVENPKVRSVARFITPVTVSLRKPQVATGDGETITATLY